MRNLDDQNTYATVDPRNLRGRILEMGKDCQNGYATGKSLAPLPGAGSIRQIVIAAMGGSAAGASLAAALATQTAAVPIILWKEYGLPAFAKGPETLVMALSNSGNTEEIASAFEQATQRGCAAVAITTGGWRKWRGRRARVSSPTNGLFQLALFRGRRLPCWGRWWRWGFCQRWRRM